MIGLLICFLIFSVLLWLVAMYGIWRKSVSEATQVGISEALAPTYKKSTRFVRRIWFTIVRWAKMLVEKLGKLIAQGFFVIFPNARKAFEKKDELTGLEHGPSSYFLMSVSEYKEELEKVPKKIRRNKKNV